MITCWHRTCHLTWSPVGPVAQDFGDFELLVAAGQARFGAEQLGEVADTIGGPGLVRDRQPFAIGLGERRLA
jgi:hypothetical protein